VKYVVGSVLLLAALASAQWLETTIRVSDSRGYMGPEFLVYDSIDNTAMGRRVRDPKPGVYFVHEWPGTGGLGPGKTRKVIVTP
jgi:hypothetical protein